jgi:ribonuclease D
MPWWPPVQFFPRVSATRLATNRVGCFDLDHAVREMDGIGCRMARRGMDQLRNPSNRDSGAPVRYVAGMEPITTTPMLAAACTRLARHPFVTVDTEFLRESTYFPILGVVQMASPEEAVVIDALAQGIDLQPLYGLMADESVLKVFHAARQDIEIVWHRAGLIPHPIFDTQVAAMVLGYGDSISYDQLVHRITGDSLDKSHRFTDWTRRPLTAAQIAYAISDVTHLRDVYLALSADLERRGRADWVREEMEVLTSPETYRLEPESAR